jgi:hypothetical protein
MSENRPSPPIPTTNNQTGAARDVGNKLFRWIVFNLVLALFPLGATLFVHSLTGKLTYTVLVNSPEILFLALTVSATALRDLYESAPFLRKEMIYNVLYYALFLGLIMSAVFYGLFILDSIINPDTPGLRAALLKYSIALTLLLSSCSAITVVLLSRIEAKQ